MPRQQRIRHDPRHIAYFDPEGVKIAFGQWFVSTLPGNTHSPDAVSAQLPRRLTEQNVPRSGLGVNQGQAVGLDLADPSDAKEYVDREWRPERIFERYDWLFAYDATTATV